MGSMHEMIEAQKQEAFKGPDFTEAKFKVLAEGYHQGKTEVEVKTGLNFIDLYAGVFEGDLPTNGIINIANPWDLRVSWRLTGPLREMICGMWCVALHLESIGEGKEFTLHAEEFEFNCNHRCYSVCIPGGGIEPSDCTTPYKVVCTVAYKSMCGKPGPIVGVCNLGLVQFYSSDY